MKTRPEIIKVAMADDHVLLRNALASLIDTFGDCKVVYQCANGIELKSKLLEGLSLDVLLLDLNMPGMNGFETADWIQKNYPNVHILMLTMYDSELTMIRLLKSGVKGFLKKDIHPSELKFAIHSVMESGYYYSNHITGKLVNLFRNSSDNYSSVQKALLGEQEINFLNLICSDMTYKEIAQCMNLNPRAIDTLRDQLFIKLDVKSRVGLAMVAIKNGLTTI